MKKLFTILWDFSISLVVFIGSGCMFLVFTAFYLIGLMFNHEALKKGDSYTAVEDSFYDQTKQELRLDNRRLLGDLEEEKRRCNEVITLKNRLLRDLEEERLHIKNIDTVKDRVLIENLELKERVGDLIRYLAMESETADIYRKIMELTNTKNESLKAEVARLEAFIDMAAKDGETDMETSERTAKFYSDYVHGDIENNKHNKMEKAICING